MNKGHEKVILVTGASSGIGKAVVELLCKKGSIVYGTSRQCSSTFEEIHNDQYKYCLLKMDVCDELSVQSAVGMVLAQEGRIDILVNNAGIGIAGAIEDMLLTESFKQMDTNFFGYLRMVSSVLPIMRRQKNGLIINIGSVAGFISIPYQGLYSASKYALEAATEALRLEVKAFGVKATLIEPGDVKTGFSQNRTLARALSGESGYKEASLRSIRKMEKDEQNGSDPQKVARAVWKAIKRKNPPIRIIVGSKYKMIYVLKKLLPSRLIEYATDILYG